MQSDKFKTLMLLFFFSFNLQASEHEASAEAPKDEVYSGKQDQNWETVQTKLAASKTKMEAQAAAVQLLIAEKDHLKGAELSLKIEEIKKQHAKYEQLVIDYNKLNDEFLTRYPERGLKEKRVYKRAKMKSLDSFEGEVTLRDRMTRLHKKVLKQYPNANRESSLNESSAHTESQFKSSKDVTETIDLKK